MPSLPFVSAPARRSAGPGMRGTGMPVRLLAVALGLGLAAVWGLGLAFRPGPLALQRGLGTGDVLPAVARRAAAPLVVTPVRVPLDPPPAAAPATAPEPPAAPWAEATAAPASPAAEQEAEGAALDSAEAEPMASAPPSEASEEADSAAPATPDTSSVAPAAPPARPRWAVAGPTSVNLRAAPSTASRVLATLAPGTVVEELGADSSGSQGWRRVLWNGREGWIAANLLRPAP